VYAFKAAFILYKKETQKNWPSLAFHSTQIIKVEKLAVTS
jgi:hypothetical protein